MSQEAAPSLVTLSTPPAGAESLAGLGFERIQHISGTTYRDSSTIVIVPTRGIREQRDGREIMSPMFHQKVVQAWSNLMSPMNQKKAFFYTTGHEVGQAYNEMIKQILASPDLSKWKYILTLEDDNVPPADAHIRLLESIDYGPYDAVSGIYFTKGDWNMPQAYGDPDEYKKSGRLDFKPRDVRAALARGNVMEVNGIAMGCALWRLDLFRQVPSPWFVTVSDVIPEKGPVAFTQDLYFCERARKAGKRFAVDFRVKVGHLDIASGVIY